MQTFAKAACLATGVAAIAGCATQTTQSGSSSSDPRIYETLTSTAAVTSPIGGVALRSNGTTSLVDITTSTGELTHDTGAFSLDDGSNALNDPDGPTAGNYVDPVTPSSTLTADGQQGFAGTYEFVTAFEQSYVLLGAEINASGMFGVITDAGDVPGGGSATYTGEALVAVATATEGVDIVGTSTVSADFDAGTVEATLDGFTARSQATGAVVASPIDEMVATGMTISGNRFEGGTVATNLGGAPVALTGGNTAQSAAGAFFGPIEGDGPDEVAGVMLIQGDDGIVTGSFIAD